MDKPKFWATAVVVLYNTRIEDSSTLSVLRKYSDQIKTVVCDNSTTNINDKKALWDTASYISMNGNQGLAAAYNRALRHREGECVCIFDDDSDIDNSYFPTLKKELCDLSWDIALPIVYSGDKIISPSHMTLFRSQPIADPDARINPNRATGINSGMAIRTYVFDSCEYSQTLFLDFIDHEFCRRTIQNGFRLKYIPSMKLKQDYSFNTDSCEGALVRIHIFEKDARSYYGDKLLGRIYCEIMLIRRKLLMAYKYKCISFIIGK